MSLDNNSLVAAPLSEIVHDESYLAAASLAATVEPIVKPIDETEEKLLLAVKRNGLMLEFIKEEYQTAAICEAAVEQNGEALRFIRCLSLKTPQVCLAAVKQNWKVLGHVPFVHYSPEIWCAVVRQNPESIRKVNPDFCLTPDVILAATGI